MNIGLIWFWLAAIIWLGVAGYVVSLVWQSALKWRNFPPRTESELRRRKRAYAVTLAATSVYVVGIALLIWWGMRL